uniref:Little elongation complex subunit 2 C-terminal domain-containing protein n=1 Tax=Meloidogyne incognita TaxID=6306 RepID=A0A914M378_MELIC
MPSKIKNISIDQDSPAEDNETTESCTDPSIIENACPQCSAFRANADRAWDILREFQAANEQNKKFKNEIHQLESQLKESRDYVSVLRQQQQDYDKIIKEKDLRITLSDEKIANLEDQYSRVLRAWRQRQNDSDKIIKGPECSQTDPIDSLEIDDDDLSLELPLSPPKKAVPDPLSIDEIFNSSFFLEHAKNKLLDDLEPFNFFLPSPAPKKKDFEGHQRFQKAKENEGPQILTTSTAPQFCVQLTDENSKLQIYNISKKYKIDKKQAALLYSQAKRDANRKRRLEPSDDENDGGESMATSDTVKSEKAPRHLLPWVPHRQVVRTQTRSVLSYEDHKRYVGIIVNELQSVPRYRFEHNKTEIQALDQKLEDERNFYIKNALQSAKQFKAFHFDNSQLKTFTEHYHEMINLYIGQRVFQGVLSSIPWPRTQPLEDPTLHPYIRTTKLLSPGLAPTTQIPEIKRKFIFSNKPVRQMLIDSLKDKQPIDEDKKVVDFALLNGIHVSMDASTLRHLLSAPWSQRTSNYACKVKVFSRVFSGKLCKICIISPPLIASRVHKTAIPRAFAKWGLKAFLFGKDPSFADAASSNQPKDSCQSLLDDLGLGNVGKVDTKHSRKRYSIISFDDPKLEISSQEQHQVLIRTNVHANEVRRDGQLQQISLTSRVEFLPEIGAEKLSNEEQIWNFITGLLKGSDEHINFRLKVERESVVLQYDRRLPTKIDQLSIEAKAVLATRINRVKILIEELPKLSVGEYLLMPDADNEMLQIIKQQTDSEEINLQQSTSFDNFCEDKSNLWEETRSRTVG